MAETSQTPKSLKAQITRTSLVLAAAALLREQGPKAVTYRKVAKWAGAASSSVGYYFDSVTQLLHEAGRYNIQLWAERAEKAASAAEGLEPEECRRHVIDLLIRACLPDESVVPSAHYGQLIAAAESVVVTEAYQKGRVSLDRYAAPYGGRRGRRRGSGRHFRGVRRAQVRVRYPARCRRSLHQGI